ncbi:hypothetical protein KC343_g11367 [Hortaea werneckii]|nr:hypothetical protein KC352_g22769 [Hortaea werneckii]KAI7557514.1 hypothetical protein KC317_g11576 [Hortaea werneckii]KAI7604887.1 hypothetical protein KC346_g11285 [Hortaea werneckii]KAI7611976.1 hypothetical protein KC343_g11367 [Hortaea werneckii]KAI7649915.1 hypothetical protein KC319_g11151 [Hortaea werneckii]
MATPTAFPGSNKSCLSTRKHLAAFKQPIGRTVAAMMRIFHLHHSNSSIEGDRHPRRSHESGKQLEALSSDGSLKLGSDGNTSQESGYSESQIYTQSDSEALSIKCDSGVSFGAPQIQIQIDQAWLRDEINEALGRSRETTGFEMLPLGVDDESTILSVPIRLQPVELDKSSIISLDLDWIVRRSSAKAEHRKPSPTLNPHKDLPRGVSKSFGGMSFADAAELAVGHIPVCEPVELPVGMTYLRRPNRFGNEFERSI